MDKSNSHSRVVSSTNSIENEWSLLEALEAQSETSQADLAARAGVAVGTVNWYLKKWAAKGYVKVKRIDRWRWSYLLTPEGLMRKSVLAQEYVVASMSLYRKTRRRAQALLGELIDHGYSAILIDGDCEIADVCRLTCLELGISAKPLVNDAVQADATPVLAVQGTDVTLSWPTLPPR